MENKICKILKKEEVVWDSELNKFMSEILDVSCDITGKGCKLADKFKEDHTLKFEKKIEVCS